MDNLQRQIDSMTSKMKLLTQALQLKNAKISELQFTLQDTVTVYFIHLLIDKEQESQKSEHLQLELFEEHEKVLTLEYQLSETTKNLRVKNEELEDFKDMYLRLKGADVTISGYENVSLMMKNPLNATFNDNPMKNVVSSTFSETQGSISCCDDTLTERISHSLSPQRVDHVQSQDESSTATLNSNSPFLCKSTTFDIEDEN